VNVAPPRPSRSPLPRARASRWAAQLAAVSSLALACSGEGAGPPVAAGASGAGAGGAAAAPAAAPPAATASTAATPDPTAAAPSPTAAAAAPAPAAPEPDREWWCTCYAKVGPEPVTACRLEESDCRGLESMAIAGSRGFVARSLTHSCRVVLAPHPGDTLGGRELWKASKKAGAWLSVGACRIPGPPDVDPNAAAEAGADPFALVAAESLDALKLGMSVAEIEAKLGKPSSSVADTEEEPATGLFLRTDAYGPVGLTVTYSAGSANGPWTVHGLLAEAPSRVKSKRGIAIGATRAAVEAAYGAVRDRDVEPSPDSFIAGSIYGGLFFDFDGEGRVTSMFLGVGAE